MNDNQADAVRFWLMELNEEYSIMNCDPDGCDAIRRMLPAVVKTQDEKFKWKLETISEPVLKDGLRRAKKQILISTMYENLYGWEGEE